MKNKITLLCIALAAFLSCNKNGPDSGRSLGVEFGADVVYAQDTLLYINLSDEAALNLTDLRDYLHELAPSTAMILASEGDASSVMSACAGWGWTYSYTGASLEGKQAVILSREKAVGSMSSLAGVVSVSYPSYSLVTGLYSDSLLEQTEALKGKILCFESASNPSDGYYRLSFNNCIEAQWSGPVATGLFGRRDFVFARPAQWSLMGAIHLDTESAWVHFPIRFTIKKEQ